MRWDLQIALAGNCHVCMCVCWCWCSWCWCCCALQCTPKNCTSNVESARRHLFISKPAKWEENNEIISIAKSNYCAENEILSRWRCCMCIYAQELHKLISKSLCALETSITVEFYIPFLSQRQLHRHTSANAHKNSHCNWHQRATERTVSAMHFKSTFCIVLFVFYTPQTWTRNEHV